MRASEPRVMALSNDLVLAHEHASDHRIGFNAPLPFRRQLQGGLHETFVIDDGGVRHRMSSRDDIEGSLESDQSMPGIQSFFSPPESGEGRGTAVGRP